MSKGLGLNDLTRDPDGSDSGPTRLSPAMSSRRLMVLVFVRDYIQRNAGSPSLSEIANFTAIPVVGVKRHIDRLVEQGELMRVPGPRGLRLPTMREAALRCLREHGFKIDEDLLRIASERGDGTEKQLLPPPTLSYRRRATGGGDHGDRDDESGQGG